MQNFTLEFCSLKGKQSIVKERVKNQKVFCNFMDIILSVFLLFGSLSIQRLFLTVNYLRKKKSFINDAEAPLHRCSYKKVVLKICGKFIGEHRCRSAISKKLQSNFIETVLWHGCSLISLLDIFRTPFLKNTSNGLLLLIGVS